MVNFPGNVSAFWVDFYGGIFHVRNFRWNVCENFKDGYPYLNADYNSLRVTLQFGPLWLTHRHTDGFSTVIYDGLSQLN